MIKIAAVLFSYYPDDVRPCRESEALTEAGMKVDMICLRKEGQKSEETVNGVNVFRLPLKKKRESKLSYVLQYATFIVQAFLKLSTLHLRKRYHVVHVHNMPDILVLSAIMPKLGGGRILLDLHDPMPELFMTKYLVGKSHPFIRFLAGMEKFSIRFADVVVTPNISFRNLFITRGCPEDKISIVMNSPSEKIFSLTKSIDRQQTEREPNQFVIMFHGSIFERNGIDDALEAIASLRGAIPGLKFKVFGSGDYVNEFLDLVKLHSLQDIVSYHRPVTPEQICAEIMSTDLGIIPNKKNPFSELNLPVRIFEYLSLGKPVVVPKTQGIRDYFDDGSIFFFEGGNALSLRNAILDIYRNKNGVHDVVTKGMQVHHQHRWELQKKVLIDRVTSLAGQQAGFSGDESGS